MHRRPAWWSMSSRRVRGDLWDSGWAKGRVARSPIFESNETLLRLAPLRRTPLGAPPHACWSSWLAATRIRLDRLRAAGGHRVRGHDLRAARDGRECLPLGPFLDDAAAPAPRSSVRDE